MEERNELLVLGNNDIMESVAGTVMEVQSIGQYQCSKFIDKLLSKCVTPVTEPMPKNKRPPFSRPEVKGPSKGSIELLPIKNDCN